jgi:hypothetical protein
MVEQRRVQRRRAAADTERVGTRRRRDADDVLRMAQHRRSMQALNRAAESAAALAEAHSAEAETEHGDVPVMAPDENVRSLTAARAKRHHHPAGRGRG